MTQRLAEYKHLGEHSYEWLRLLKYKCDKRVMIKTSEEDQFTSQFVLLFPLMFAISNFF